MAKKRGPKALSAEEHLKRGTFRSDRHQMPDLARLPPVTGRSAVGSQPAHEYVSDVDREAVLSQLQGHRVGYRVRLAGASCRVGSGVIALDQARRALGVTSGRLG